MQHPTVHLPNNRRITRATFTNINFWRWGQIFATVAILAGCGDPQMTRESETPTTPPTLNPETTSENVGDRGLENLPDGEYFYGQSPTPDAPGQLYVVFRKTANSMSGLKYAFQTDNSGCFQGIAQGEKVVNLQGAYAQPSRDGLQWSMEQNLEPLDLTGFHSIGFENIPDYAQQSFQQCVAIFAE
jgi:hypothetical protein